MLETINQIDLHADIRARLEMYIQDNGLKPGDRLPSEHELANALNVSRNALREALRSLEALGLIKAQHGRGRFLNDFSFDTVGVTLGHLLILDISRASELLEIRKTLEIGFLPEAARKLQTEDIEALREIVARMHAKRADGTTTNAGERAFHSTLFRRIDNRLLKELLTLFWNLLDRVRKHDLLPPSHASNMVDMHEAVVEHIAAGEIDDAVAVFREHFTDLADRLQQASINWHNSAKPL